MGFRHHCFEYVCVKLGPFSKRAVSEQANGQVTWHSKNPYSRRKDRPWATRVHTWPQNTALVIFLTVRYRLEGSCYQNNSNQVQRNNQLKVSGLVLPFIRQLPTQFLQCKLTLNSTSKQMRLWSHSALSGYMYKVSLSSIPKTTSTLNSLA